MSRSLTKAGDLLVCVLLILVLPYAASEVANVFTPLLPAIDPDGVFLWITVHHLAQLILTIVVALVFRIGFRDLGFNMDRRDESLRLLGTFLAYFVLLVLAGHVILYLATPEPNFEHPLNFRNVAGELGFKALVAGTSEEPLFRGLVMGLLFRSWDGDTSVFGLEISSAGLIATILFVVAHIGFSIDPFAITWLDPVQLLQAGILGFFYAVAFERTGSLLTPIIAHNFANTFISALGMIWATIG